MNLRTVILIRLSRCQYDRESELFYFVLCCTVRWAVPRKTAAQARKRRVGPSIPEASMGVRGVNRTNLSVSGRHRRGLLLLPQHLLRSNTRRTALGVLKSQRFWAVGNGIIPTLAMGRPPCDIRRRLGTPARTNLFPFSRKRWYESLNGSRGTASSRRTRSRLEEFQSSKTFISTDFALSGKGVLAAEFKKRDASNRIACSRQIITNPVERNNLEMTVTVWITVW